MRRMILRMIASGSLSAFSAAALQGLDAARPASAAPVQRARTAPVQAASPSALAKPGAPPPAAGQILPRGSLLDLSV